MTNVNPGDRPVYRVQQDFDYYDRRRLIYAMMDRSTMELQREYIKNQISDFWGEHGSGCALIQDLIDEFTYLSELLGVPDEIP